MTDGVEVLVVAYGSATLLEQCLGSLCDQLPLIVVDNSSDPQVREVALRHRASYVDPGHNVGFAAGVNIGTVHRGHPAADLLLLNPDASIGPAEVRRLQRALHARPDLACVAPAQSSTAGGAPDRVAWPFPSPLGAWVEAIGLGRLRRRQDFLIGSVLLLRAAALRDVGSFDEQFFLYAEETDWQRRARDRGWSVALCPHVTAIHLGAGTGGDERARETHFHASNERYIRKHHGTLGWWVYRSGVFTGSLFRTLVLPGARSRTAAFRFRLYRLGPCRAEASLDDAHDATRDITRR